MIRLIPRFVRYTHINSRLVDNLPFSAVIWLLINLQNLGFMRVVAVLKLLCVTERDNIEICSLTFIFCAIKSCS